eukprot:CAMPEP_0118930062 /NCGR_PEP_ID=MMETSP1169-20130426/6877_1 /TAXON_ID=36882 /ORGANISM="Pyramimonas obovata, Strain CCMP722" /LENGTH=118 /DNA_ID=CAMNT_0006872361 /DNA_START=205 /DNA_END=561 /DNA_ORIENTATION=-
MPVPLTPLEVLVASVEKETAGAVVGLESAALDGVARGGRAGMMGGGGIGGVLAEKLGTAGEGVGEEKGWVRVVVGHAGFMGGGSGCKVVAGSEEAVGGRNMGTGGFWGRVEGVLVSTP